MAQLGRETRVGDQAAGLRQMIVRHQDPAGEDPDGSADLLGILAGRPEQYAAFAGEYYERDVDVGEVAAIYRHEPLSVELVRRLNPDIDLASLADDIAEIGYPR